MPTIEKFPKSYKFTFGDRIETIAIDVLKALIEATSSRYGKLPTSNNSRHLRSRRRRLRSPRSRSLRSLGSGLWRLRRLRSLCNLVGQIFRPS